MKCQRLHNLLIENLKRIFLIWISILLGLTLMTCINDREGSLKDLNILYQVFCTLMPQMKQGWVTSFIWTKYIFKYVV